jgi:hypothetical protein
MEPLEILTIYDVCKLMNGPICTVGLHVHCNVHVGRQKWKISEGKMSTCGPPVMN